jgi:predicted amidohydrolase YtcJ
VRRIVHATAVCATALWMAMGASSAQPPGDLIFTHGAIYTLEARQPWAQALVVAQGKIAFVGDDAGALAYRGPRTHVIDLHGRMMLPGFHDGHAHPMTGAMRLLQCRLDGLASAKAIYAAVTRCAAQRPTGWVLGNGWSPKTAGPLSRAALDALLPKRPAILRNEDGYAAWVNSAALRAAAIDPDGTAPKIEGLERDARTGRPTGLLTNDAVELVRSHVPPPSEADLRVALRLSTAMANRFGITSIFDASVKPDALTAYVAADRAGALTVRIVAAQLVDTRKGSEQVADFIARRDAIHSPHLRADAAKIFLDGEFENHTAALIAPYADQPGFSGRPYISERALDVMVHRLDAAGFMVHMHAMGDRAVRMGLNAVAWAIDTNPPRDRRHQIAHLGLIQPDDARRFARLGVTANVQPLWFAADDPAAAPTDRAVGPGRQRMIFPVAGVVAAGGRIVAGSDWPGPTMNPLDGIQYALTRQPLDGSKPPRQPEQRLTLATMLAAYTRDAAWAAREDALDGTLALGKAADLIVLDRNLFEVAPRDIHRVRVVLTLLDGRVVYRR